MLQVRSTGYDVCVKTRLRSESRPLGMQEAAEQPLLAFLILNSIRSELLSAAPAASVSSVPESGQSSEMAA
jgi:hypothetical protein